MVGRMRERPDPFRTPDRVAQELEDGLHRLDGIMQRPV